MRLAAGPENSPPGSRAPTLLVHGTMTALRPLPRGALAAAGLAAAAGALVACTREARHEALQPAQLSEMQARSLQQMNAAGPHRFGGWSWTYGFGAGCVLRVQRRYEGAPDVVTDLALAGHVVEVVPYATDGFGVKARDPAHGGTLDLFEAGQRADADAFARAASRLIAPCGK